MLKTEVSPAVTIILKREKPRLFPSESAEQNQWFRHSDWTCCVYKKYQNLWKADFAVHAKWEETWEKATNFFWEQKDKSNGSATLPTHQGEKKKKRGSLAQKRGEECSKIGDACWWQEEANSNIICWCESAFIARVSLFTRTCTASLRLNFSNFHT